MNGNLCMPDRESLLLQGAPRSVNGRVDPLSSVLKAGQVRGRAGERGTFPQAPASTISELFAKELLRRHVANGASGLLEALLRSGGLLSPRSFDSSLDAAMSMRRKQAVNSSSQMRREAAHLRHGPYHKRILKRGRLLEISGFSSVSQMLREPTPKFLWTDL